MCLRWLRTQPVNHVLPLTLTVFYCYVAHGSALPLVGSVSLTQELYVIRLSLADPRRKGDLKLLIQFLAGSLLTRIGCLLRRHSSADCDGQPMELTMRTRRPHRPRESATSVLTQCGIPTARGSTLWGRQSRSSQSSCGRHHDECLWRCRDG